MATTKNARGASAAAVVTCTRCGAGYGPDYITGWGKTHGVGYGPKPVCVELVGPNNEPLDRADATTPRHACLGAITYAGEVDA